MKKTPIIILVAIILTIAGCKKTEIIPAIKPINLGTKSTSMNFNSETTQVGNNVSFSVVVTPGSKYSFQVTDFKGDVIKSQGLVADETLENITINLDKVDVGVYDLIFIDTQGNEIKKPLIIK
jgi:hypothetical protein